MILLLHEIVYGLTKNYQCAFSSSLMFYLESPLLFYFFFVKSLPNLGTLGVYFMFTLSFAYSVYDGWSNLVRKQQLWSGRKLSDLLVVKKRRKLLMTTKVFSTQKCRSVSFCHLTILDFISKKFFFCGLHQPLILEHCMRYG